jgi:hypothetical protein
VKFVFVVSRCAEVGKEVPLRELSPNSLRGIETLFSFQNWNGGFRVTKRLLTSLAAPTTIVVRKLPT